jgi:hypothetical protein
VIWIATARDGRLSTTPVVKMRLQEHLKANEGKMYRIEFREPTRSLSQNNYFHLYRDIVARETGNDLETLKEHWIHQHAPRILVPFNGKMVYRPKRTHEMTKLEMSEFLDKCSADCEVPLPDPTTLENYIPN